MLAVSHPRAGAPRTVLVAAFASRASKRPPPPPSPTALASDLLELLGDIGAPLLDAAERGSPASQKRLAVHSLGPTRDRDEALAVAKEYITNDTKQRIEAGGGEGPYTIAATSGAPGTGKSQCSTRWRSTARSGSPRPATPSAFCRSR